MSDISEAAAASKKLRTELHKIPEMSMHEVKTPEKIASFLKEYTDFNVVIERGWLYAFKPAEDDGSIRLSPIAFRADFDAVNLPGSKLGHFCGHDGHSAILCGAAYALSGMHVNRDIYLLFQPGEETGEGALVVKDIIKKKQISEIYALHNLPGFKIGQIVTADNTFALASTGLRVALHGKPTHAAYPENGLNPIGLITEFYQKAEELKKAYEEKGEFIMLTPIGIDGGSYSYGVAASDAELRMTVRGGHEDAFCNFLSDIEGIYKSLADDGGFGLDIEEIERFPATENDPSCTAKIRDAAQKAEISHVDLKEPMRWSEDFGWYTRECAGAFFGIGAGTDHAQLHTEKYEFPDEILEQAIKVFVELALG